MRVKAIIVLLAVLITIFSPVSLTLKPASDGTFLITLDVCNANAGGPLKAADGAYIPFYPFQICKLCVISFIEPEKINFTLFLLPTTLEHPPKV
ncbi:MAG: hypothetical protein GXO99_00550 [Nitrospirae bacterium]|nr:hypothetical protein [Nitrospirota bacterium]